MNSARNWCIFVGFLCCGVLSAATYRYPLKISSANPRILVDQNNVPFLMVGDSPHSIFSNLSSADAEIYLADRAARGINALWVNLLCIRPVEGRPDASLLDGTKPFTATIPGTRYYDLTTPNEAYFAHADQVVQMAAKDGIVMMIDPLETAGWLQTALANGPDRCRTYGRYLGNRYKGFSNIIWLNGNDFQRWAVPANDAVITAVALGIKDEAPKQLQTLELNYQASCSLDDPNWAPIVGLNLAYTYYATYAKVLHCYNQSAKIPTFMGEANFEYERQRRRRRRLASRSPHAGILEPCSPGRPASFTAISISGDSCPAGRAISSRPASFSWATWRICFRLGSGMIWCPTRSTPLSPPATASYVSTGPPATATTARFADNDYVTAAVTPDGTLGMAYLPQGGTITVAMSKLQNGITARWFDPTDDAFQAIAGSPFSNQGTHEFATPGKNGAGDPDWVLVLEAARP